MKKITALQFTGFAATVAALGIGCASSGYARYDGDSTYRDDEVVVSTRSDMDPDLRIRTQADLDREMGVSASADTGTDRDLTVVNRYRDPVFPAGSDITDNMIMPPDTEGEERITVSALSFNPDTRAEWITKFPFYDPRWQLRTIDTYTFTPPSDDFDDDDYRVRTRTTVREFDTSTRPGTVYVEAAGGPAVYETGRVIQHSPNPTR
jgi:hypothetical protein